jgi:phage terminase large subunit
VSEELFASRETEVLVEGPAGTGKSRTWLERIHRIASDVPEVRILLCRKTRSSLTESALVTFERFVLPPNHAAREGPRRFYRQAYHYPNGSEILVDGLDKASKILGTEFDLVFVQEATELTEEDWETLITRLRAGTLDYQQIGGDCNPDRAGHWLNQRCLDGRTRRIVTRHEDNPLYFDSVAKVWTEAGASYLKKLDALSGARRLRLRDGKWASADGLVYEGFDRAIHLVDRFTAPDDWARIWVVDFGFTNPFVWQEWVRDPDGRLFLSREIYRTRRMVVDHAKLIARTTRGSRSPIAVICDHDAEGRAVLERELGVRTIGAIKKVREGIQAVQARLVASDDGRPRLFLMRDALVERDQDLVDLKRPTSTEEEFDGYVWQSDTSKDLPVKESDHGMDCMRYLCTYLEGNRIRRSARSYSGN